MTWIPKKKQKHDRQQAIKFQWLKTSHLYGLPLKNVYSDAQIAVISVDTADNPLSIDNALILIKTLNSHFTIKHNKRASLFYLYLFKESRKTYA